MVPQALTISAADFLPATSRPSLTALRKAAATCEGCDLHLRGTQTVFGAGAARARVVLIGEQPGDREDREGLPFVGPAGRLLERALADAKIDRRTVYLTNAVKHFNWTPVGKRRLHAKPKLRHIRACRPWLDAELRRIQPLIVVCLGATAAQALLGSTFRVTQQRGVLMTDAFPDFSILATVHPSAVLRARKDDRDQAYAASVADLVVVGGFLTSSSRST